LVEEIAMTTLYSVENAVTALYSEFFVIIFLAGGALLSHLGGGTVPNMLKPISIVWVKSGLSPKSFSFVLWGLFALIAFTMLVFLGVPLYISLMDLGRGFK
jgi:hypothetical protein